MTVNTERKVLKKYQPWLWADLLKERFYLYLWVIITQKGIQREWTCYETVFAKFQNDVIHVYVSSDKEKFI